MEVPVPIGAITLQWGVVIGASLIAAIWDCKSRRIPNGLTLPLAASGLAVAAWQTGWYGLGQAIAACIVLALPYVVLWVWAHGGAGDAKMMGALGCWLGLTDGVVVLLAVAVTGGLFGLLRMIAAKQRRLLLSNMVASLYVGMITVCGGAKIWPVPGPESQGQADRDKRRATMPYGPAIFIGVCIGFLVVQLWHGR